MSGKADSATEAKIREDLLRNRIRQDEVRYFNLVAERDRYRTEFEAALGEIEAEESDYRWAPHWRNGLGQAAKIVREALARAGNTRSHSEDPA